MTTQTAIPAKRATVHVLLMASDAWQSQCIEMALADARNVSFDVCHRQQTADAKQTLASNGFDVVVLQIPSGSEDFLEVMIDLRPRIGTTPLIIIAPVEKEALAVQAVAQGADDYLLEGELGGERLASTVHHLVERRALRTEIGEMNGKVVEMQSHCKQEMQRLAGTRDAAKCSIEGLSHEFRTPLTVVQEYCALVRDGLAGPVTAEQCHYLDIAADRVGDLNRMLNDYVDSSALESGVYPVRRKPARLIEIVERLRPALLAKAAIRQARIEIWVSADLPEVFCDAEIASRLICNLVSQALKAPRSEGSVRIWAERAPNQRQVILAVGDNCLGAARDDVNLFLRSLASAPDESAANSTRAIFSLGMAQTLARINLGDFRILRDSLRGTIYLVALPEVDPEVVMAGFISERKRSGNSPSTVALVLVSLDMEAGIATAELLDNVLFDAAADGDLVLRVETFVWALIVDVTVLQASLVIARVQDAWLQTNRSKKIKRPPEILVEAKATYHLNSQNRKTQMPTAAVSPQSKRPILEKPRILLVDDDRSIVEALLLRLTLAGYDVFVAYDGRQGLAAAVERQPDLIVLDIRMPVMDGLTMLAKMREDEATQDIPVVVVSASHDNRQQALGLGARFFIEKPYDANVLRVTIAAALQRAATKGCVER